MADVRYLLDGSDINFDRVLVCFVLLIVLRSSDSVKGVASPRQKVAKGKVSSVERHKALVEEFAMVEEGGASQVWGESLSARMKNLQAGVSDRTGQGYNYWWNWFVLFCGEAGCEPMPFTAVLVSAFLSNLAEKSSGLGGVDGALEWTHELVDGRADSSLALDAARVFRVPEPILERAGALLPLLEQNLQHRHQLEDNSGGAGCTMNEDAKAPVAGKVDVAEAEVALVLSQLQEIAGSDAKLHELGPRMTPPPNHRLRSAVYVLGTLDGRWYVGESDDVGERVAEHRRRDPDRASASVHYVLVGGGKSGAMRLEAELIGVLAAAGVPLLSRRDGGRTRVAQQ